MLALSLKRETPDAQGKVRDHAIHRNEYFFFFFSHVILAFFKFLPQKQRGHFFDPVSGGSEWTFLPRQDDGGWDFRVTAHKSYTLHQSNTGETGADKAPRRPRPLAPANHSRRAPAPQSPGQLAPAERGAGRPFPEKPTVTSNVCFCRGDAAAAAACPGDSSASCLARPVLPSGLLLFPLRSLSAEATQGRQDLRGLSGHCR